jgi:hypothetical protein
MPDNDSQCEKGRWHPLSHWETLSAEVVCYNIHVGTNIAEYWRHVAEIHLSALMSIAAARETPSDRRRKFRVIDGGKS